MNLISMGFNQMDHFYSMTGHGKAECVKELFSVVVEIRSLNHRYLDIKLRNPPSLMPLELSMRKIIKDKMVRGSIDVNIQIKKNDAQRYVDFLDIDKINAFLQMAKSISEHNEVDLVFRPSDFTSSEFMQAKREKSLSPEDLALIEECLIKSLQSINTYRMEEGDKLVEKIRMYLNSYQQSLQLVKVRHESSRPLYQDKLLNALKQKGLAENVDSTRFAQEVVYYLEKTDIEEELTRIRVHLDKLVECLSIGGEAGRKIEFVIQELFRETNTLASKSSDPQIVSEVVEMKTTLDKIREQCLNLV